MKLQLYIKSCSCSIVVMEVGLYTHSTEGWKEARTGSSWNAEFIQTACFDWDGYETLNEIIIWEMHLFLLTRIPTLNAICESPQFEQKAMWSSKVIFPLAVLLCNGIHSLGAQPESHCQKPFCSFWGPTVSLLSPWKLMKCCHQLLSTAQSSLSSQNPIVTDISLSNIETVRWQVSSWKHLYPPAMPDCVRHLYNLSASICPSCPVTAAM